MAHQPPPDIAVTMSVVPGVLGLFGFFCPPIHAADTADPQKIDAGRIKAGIASLALGAAGTAGTGSPWPLLAAIAVTVALWYHYETQAHRGTA